MTRKEKEKSLSLTEIIDLEVQLAKDAKMDRQTLRERDRHVRMGLSPEQTGGSRRALFLAWLDAVMDRSESSPGRMIAGFLGLFSLLMGVGGFLFGLGAAMGVFAYDGERPVNVTRVLAVFVGLQLLLLLLLGCALLPTVWISWLPGARTLQEGIRALSPGRLVHLFARLIPSKRRESFEGAWAEVRAFDRMYGKIRFWLTVRVAQVFAVAFQLGALAGCMWLIVFSDLAFAWSTTLQVESERFYRLVELLSRPWAWFWSAATPSVELVRATRYFRHGGAFGSGEGAVDVALLGGWWPFLIASMLFYGLLPRLLAYGLARWRFSTALRRAPLDHVAFQELLERLTEPIVSTRPGEERSPEAEPARDAERGGGAVHDAVKGPLFLIRWGEQPFTESKLTDMVARRFHSAVASVFSAGVLDTEADARALEALRRNEAEQTIVLVVKGWEPPTRDLTRFIERIRERAGRGAAILALPLDQAPDGRIEAAKAEDLRHWTGKMRAMGDPWLRVVGLEKGDA